MPGKKIIAVLLFIAAALLYIGTMCPSIDTMDAGELTVAASELHIAHPTGYPLFCILGKLGTIMIPARDVAWRLNCLNALAAALAVTLLFLALAEIARREIALFAAVLFAITPVFWDVASSIEVHALSAVFLTTELLIFLRWWRSGERRLIPWLAVTAGFAMTNHLSSALVLPGLLFGIVSKDISLLKDRRLIVRSIILFVLPLSLYAYLPIRAGASHGTIWGGLYQSAGFVAHVTGRAFRALMFHSGKAMVWGNSLRFLRLLILEFPLAVAWALPVGAIIIRRRYPKLIGALLIMVAVNVGYCINYQIVDIEPYYDPTFLAMMVMLVVGLEYVITEAKRPAVRRACAVLLPVLLVCVAGHEFHRENRHNDTQIIDHADNLLRTLDQGSLLVACGDSIYNAMLYERVVNGERPDVIVLHRNITRAWPSSSKTWIGGQYYASCAEASPAMSRFVHPNKPYKRREILDETFLCDVIDQVVKERPVFIMCMGRDYDSHPMLKRLERDYQLLPWGLLTRVVPKRVNVDYAALARDNERIWQQYVIRGIYDRPAMGSELEREVPERYAQAHFDLGDVELKAAMYSDAERNYRKALGIEPDSVKARNGIALALACQRKYRQAAIEWGTVLACHPSDQVASAGLRMARANILLRPKL